MRKDLWIALALAVFVIACSLPYFMAEPTLATEARPQP